MAAFSAALYNDVSADETYADFALGQLAYVMGENEYEYNGYGYNNNNNNNDPGYNANYNADTCNQSLLSSSPLPFWWE